MLKRCLLAFGVVALVATYALAVFNPQQPLHHQLESVAGIILLATLLTWCLFPIGDDD